MGLILNIIGIVVLSIIVLWLLFIVLSYLGLISLTVTNMRVTATDEGIELKNKLNKKRFIRWDEIDSGNEPFDPPLNPPIIRLKSGEQLRLDIADSVILKENFKKHQIPYSSYKHRNNG